MATRRRTADVALPSDTEILITRQFEAPAALVWEALTVPRHLLRWWGPDWCPLVSAEIDLRPGGTWRYVSLSTSAEELGWHGVYQEIALGTRIVSTEMFEGFPDAESLNTMTLTEVDGVTTLQTRVRHRTKEHRDGHLASGMEEGMQVTFDRLDALLVTLGEPAERWRRVAGRFTERAREVPADRWDNPTPCEGWVARDVVRHMVEWMPGFASLMGVALPPGPSVDDDPVGAWEHVAAAIQAVLDDPEQAGVEFEEAHIGRHTRASAINMIFLGDVLVHTWDLARATGLDETMDPVIAAEMLEGLQPMDQLLRQGGQYGPRVDVAGDADVQTRLLAFTGRHP